jgi:hypothetical protein
MIAACAEHKHGMVTGPHIRQQRGRPPDGLVYDPVRSSSA